MKYLELIDIRLSRLPVFRIARAHRAHPRSEFLDNERPGSDGLMEVVRLALDNGKWERAERNGNVHIGLMQLQDDGIGYIGLGVLEVSRKLAQGGQNPFFLMR